MIAKYNNRRCDCDITNFSSSQITNWSLYRLTHHSHRSISGMCPTFLLVENFDISVNFRIITFFCDSLNLHIPAYFREFPYSHVFYERSHSCAFLWTSAPRAYLILRSQSFLWTTVFMRSPAKLNVHAYCRNHIVVNFNNARISGNSSRISSYSCELWHPRVFLWTSTSPCIPLNFGIPVYFCELPHPGVFVWTLASPRISVNFHIPTYFYELWHLRVRSDGRASIFGRHFLWDQTFLMVPCRDFDLWPTSSADLSLASWIIFLRICFYLYRLRCKMWTKCVPAYLSSVSLIRQKVLQFNISHSSSYSWGFRSVPGKVMLIKIFDISQEKNLANSMFQL